MRDGGGVQGSIESQVLTGKAIAAPHQIRVQAGAQVLKVVEQEPAALGLSQLNLLMQSRARELSTDPIVAQKLSLATLGEPSATMREVIDAVQQIATAAHE